MIDLAPCLVLPDNQPMPTPHKNGKSKKPDSPKSRSTNRHKHPHVGFNLEAGLLELVDRDASANDRKRSQQLSWIIKQHYRAAGLWPPADDPEE